MSGDLSERIEGIVAVAMAGAARTDAEAAFPQEAIAQFRTSGLAGLLSASEVGGMGGSLRDAARVIELLGTACASTAMIVCMHYSAAVVIEACGTSEDRAALASGRALATLAFSEAGSRSHFWAPVSTARRDGGDVLLNARKSWVTSANHAELYVWSSQATAGEGSSMWLVTRGTEGIAPSGGFDGLGLRGNDSAPVAADDARVPATALLGEDGKGADIMLGTVLPVFSVLSAAAAAGIMGAAIERTLAHVGATGFAHLGQGLSSLPTIRAYIARMQVKADLVRAMIAHTLDAIETPGDHTMLRVLEVKAAAGEASIEVSDLAMRVCGGAAFRKEAGIERALRDSRAAVVMAPTTDQLYDFIGRALCGIDLFA